MQVVRRHDMVVVDDSTKGRGRTRGRGEQK